MESPYAPLLRQFKACLPREIYMKIDNMSVDDTWALRITWMAYPQPAPLIIPLVGTNLGYDALVSIICLMAP